MLNFLSLFTKVIFLIKVKTPHAFFGATLIILFLIKVHCDETSSLSDKLSLGISDIQNRMEQIFKLIDVNNDGKLSNEEVFNWSKQVKVNSNLSQAKMEIEALDKDGNGKISLAEIEEAASHDQDEKALEVMRSRFRIVDKDGDGLLSETELLALLIPGINDELLESDITYMIKHQDKDGDGKISFEEFNADDDMEDTVASEDSRKEFNAYDLNGDGFIDADEIRKNIPISSMGEMINDVNELFKDVKELTKEYWDKNIAQLALSPITDGGEILRFPKDYNLGLSFDNIDVEDRIDDEEL